MKKILLMVFLSVIAINCISQDDKLNIIVIGAHPDDCDEFAGGTTILYSKLGHRVKFVSMTNGDAGHQSMGGGALAKRRMLEAREAGKRFGVEYLVIDNHDGELMPTLENRLKIIREIRNWKADIVITHPPDDYHPDHRNTSILVQDASYMVIVPNVAPDTPPLKKNPVFLYPGFSSPEIAVDIDAVFDQKVYAVSAHESQFFEWLPWTEGTLDKVPSGREERLKYVAEWFGTVSETEKACLKKWYGEARAVKVLHAETFRYAPYGRKPSEEETRKLFPMIK
ncbi:MAG TPA: PIG-L family deacetylase [Bacteroidales bacterium]|jgi:LmbE family N-acetylglucosaminyl deacetylase|nr:PIG-L family deacetylase [Bacteroidales bacterium]HOS72078.1 PIG-L family deacetylase [Bacteroidales bacterium]HQH23194.1 PIG-L family deacetylase [Bacteroidales bacterium]HQJ80948.1 PIG-L family deacetylase [Bacteroidales bacterium]